MEFGSIIESSINYFACRLWNWLFQRWLQILIVNFALQARFFTFSTAEIESGIFIRLQKTTLKCKHAHVVNVKILKLATHGLRHKKAQQELEFRKN